MMPEDAVVGGTAKALEIFEQEDGIIAIEEAASGVEQEIRSQAGRKTVFAFLDDRRVASGSLLVYADVLNCACHGSSGPKRSATAVITCVCT